MKNKKILFLTQAAVIAALYVVLTLLANALGLANYAIQVRFSEALTVLPFFTTAAIPGLYLGCLIANILTGAAIQDIIFGSLATLIGAVGSFIICRLLNYNKVSRFLVPLPPIIANTIIVPVMLAYVYQLEGTIPFFMLTVGAGEVISCYVLGEGLLHALLKPAKYIFGDDARY